MKYISLSLVLITSVLHAQKDLPAPSVLRCDAQYAQSIHDILVQFSGFTPKEKLQEYQDYMIRLKQSEDLGYKITPLEGNMTSDTRALMRTPLQHYSNCQVSIGSSLGHDVNTFSTPRETLAPCDATYAVESEKILQDSSAKYPRTLVTGYEAFLVSLKLREDLAFKISDFEKTLEKDTLSRLRFPLDIYLDCRDAIVRTSLPPQ